MNIAQEAAATERPVRKKSSNISFRPHKIKSTDPKKHLRLMQIKRGEKIFKTGRTYQGKRKICFSAGDDYTKLDGIFTFRGNNFRNSPAFGQADLLKKKIKSKWVKKTGFLSCDGHRWTGSGWTGQPLMRKWTRQEKASMKMAS